MILAQAFAVTATAYVLLCVLIIAIGLAFIRLMMGPSLPDRAVALDVIAALLVGVIALYSIALRQVSLLPVAIVLALFNFIGTIAFAYYLQLRSRQ